MAAAIAGSVAFLLTQLLLGVVWGAGWSATFFSSVAFAVAAAVAALTMKRGLAVAYGFLAAIWLLLEAVAALFAVIAAARG